MKKILVLSALLALSGCYSAAPTTQDVYVEPYVAPELYYYAPVSTETSDYIVQSNAPTITYIIEEESPDVVYINPEPAYVYLDNPLIYGRPHHHHYHNIGPKPHRFHHAHHGGSNHVSHQKHHGGSRHMSNHTQTHNKHHSGKPISLVK